MTSYHELTAERETSPLLTDSCRAEEVRNLDLLDAGGTHPELRTPHALQVDAASGFYPTFLTLCSPPLPPPPTLPPREPLGGFSTSASSRVPWRCRARGSPGRGDSNNNNNNNNESKVFQQLCLEPRGEEIHNSLNKDSKIPFSVENSDWRGADGRETTFEWMRVKRSQHRTGKLLLFF